jgi:hypothetical protein
MKPKKTMRISKGEFVEIEKVAKSRVPRTGKGTERRCQKSDMI